MLRVEGPADVTRCDPEVVLIERLPSETPADQHNTDQLVERTGCALKDVEQHEQAIPAHDGGSARAAPARSVRRATARRASTRRATARSRQADSEASIIDFLLQHRESTAGDIAKGLNLNPGQVSTHLTKLARAGEIKKASHGYTVTQAARPRPHEPDRPVPR
jgi:hypothetical protein